MEKQLEANPALRRPADCIAEKDKILAGIMTKRRIQGVLLQMCSNQAYLPLKISFLILMYVRMYALLMTCSYEDIWIFVCMNTYLSMQLARLPAKWQHCFNCLRNDSIVLIACEMTAPLKVRTTFLRTYTCMHISVCVYMHICMCVCIHLCMYKAHIMASEGNSHSIDRVYSMN